MWNRKEIKKNGKLAMKANYWKTVLVCAVFTLLTAGGGSAGGSSVADSAADATGSENGVKGAIDAFLNGQSREFLMILLAVAIGTVIIALILGLCIEIFVTNPLVIGINSFCMKNMREKARLGEIGHGFDKHYGINVKTMFAKDWYQFWWGCLFIIPGIIKSYEYRMIPYILADNAEITKKEAFRISKRMMSGHKWDMFVLDLSFIGWHILGVLTCGIVEILYTNPYYQMSVASAYETLKQKIA